MPDCWNCGTSVSVVMPGHHKYRCEVCDVEWVTEQHWDGEGVWESYEMYIRNLRNKDRNNTQRLYGLEYVDFSKDDALHTPG